MIRPSLAQPGARKAFTLVELLVVIAIIGILVALLLPAVQKAREAARRIQCANGMRQIGLAALNYESANRSYPAGSTSTNSGIGGPYWTTWAIDLLPMLEEQAIYDLWQKEFSLQGKQNAPIREAIVQAYLCPSDAPSIARVETLVKPDSGPGSNQFHAPSSYRAVSGHSLGVSGDHFWDNPKAHARNNVNAMPEEWRGAMYVTLKDPGRNDRKIREAKMKDIKDGTSKTLLVGEYQTTTVPRRASFWSYAYTSYNQSSTFFQSRTLIANYDGCYDIPGVGDHTCKRAWGALHAGGLIQFVLCDGSVHTITPDIDTDVFAASGSIKNGELASIHNE